MTNLHELIRSGTLKADDFKCLLYVEVLLARIKALGTATQGKGTSPSDLHDFAEGVAELAKQEFFPAKA